MSFWKRDYGLEQLMMYRRYLARNEERMRESLEEGKKQTSALERIADALEKLIDRQDVR